MREKSICKIELPDLEKTLKALGRLNAEQKQALAQAMFTEANLVMTTSKRQVPVDTGALRSTGHVRLAQIKGEVVSVELGYGGPAGSGDPTGGGRNYTSNQTGRVVASGEKVGYGYYVHEDLEAQHTVGKAKFLEEPLTEATGKIQKALIGALNQAARKTVK